MFRGHFSCVAICCLVLGFTSVAIPQDVANPPRAAAQLQTAFSWGPLPPLPNVPVTVTNFPVTQNVNGEVSVINLPAVQQVSGSVNVGNLPLDESGNLKVTAPRTSRTRAVVELIHGNTVAYCGPGNPSFDYWVSPPFDASPFNEVGINATIDLVSNDGNPWEGTDPTAYCSVVWQWPEDGSMQDFYAHEFDHPNYEVSVFASANYRGARAVAFGRVMGPIAKVSCKYYCWGGTNASAVIRDARVYLMSN